MRYPIRASERRPNPRQRLHLSTRNFCSDNRDQFSILSQLIHYAFAHYLGQLAAPFRVEGIIEFTLGSTFMRLIASGIIMACIGIGTISAANAEDGTSAGFCRKIDPKPVHEGMPADQCTPPEPDGSQMCRHKARNCTWATKQENQSKDYRETLPQRWECNPPTKKIRLKGGGWRFWSNECTIEVRHPKAITFSPDPRADLTRDPVPPPLKHVSKQTLARPRLHHPDSASARLYGIRDEQPPW
jgi:hypothetical protein